MVSEIRTADAPAAIGPYSQAVRVNDLVFVSGQIPANPLTGTLADGIENQTRQVFENMSAVLKAAGTGLDKVIKATVFLTDMGNFQTVNGIYSSYFKGDVLPSRSAVEVSALPKGSLIEIECIAAC